MGGLFDDKKKEGSEDGASLQQRLLNGGQDQSQDEQNKTSIKYDTGQASAQPCYYASAADANNNLEACCVHTSCLIANANNSLKSMLRVWWLSG